jgi:hypothetical protein
MVRLTAHLLVVVMFLASGRLLACGWECADELAAPAEASCHQESAPVTALNADGMHACLPEITEPRVTAAKLATDQLLMAALPVATIVPHGLITGPASDGRQRIRPRVESPHLPRVSVLRI